MFEVPTGGGDQVMEQVSPSNVGLDARRVRRQRHAFGLTVPLTLQAAADEVIE
jgi:hypothetical protein